MRGVDSETPGRSSPSLIVWMIAAMAGSMLPLAGWGPLFTTWAATAWPVIWTLPATWTTRRPVLCTMTAVLLPRLVAWAMGSPITQESDFAARLALDAGLNALAAAMAYRARHQLDVAARLSRIDSLTRLLNRTGLIERLEVEVARAVRSDKPLSLAYIDCDDFKRINDRFGHGRGDAYLWELAALIRQQVRQYDVVGRMGGDEFVIVLPDATESTALIVLQRLLRATGTLRKDSSATLSAGLATIYPPLPTADECLHAADQAMYEAKRDGKNRLHCRVLNDPAERLFVDEISPSAG